MRNDNGARLQSSASTCDHVLARTPSVFRSSWCLLRAGALVLMCALPVSHIWAQDDDADEPIELAEEDLDCLKCHDDPKLSVKLDSGETLPLYISTQDFLGSMHNENSCADCHFDIDLDTHGKGESIIASKRELGVAMGDTCRDCHKKKYREYDDSVHALLIAEGSTKAPMCADCHNPHTVRSWKLAEAEAAMPCGKCHQEIFDASAKDVHGLARGDRKNPGPVCSGCHQAHGIKAASLGTGLRDTCLNCHKDAFAKHEIWLPNAQLHFDAISCPTCHAPDAERRVNLRLYHELGGDRVQLIEKSGVPQFVRLTTAADQASQGLDDRALLGLLKDFTHEEGQGKIVLRGRLEVGSGVEAHRLADKSKAIADCKVCHQAGAQVFQRVILTMAGPDGRPLRHGVNEDVLNSAFSIDSIRGFYVLGSTRIKLLDYLLVLVVLGLAGGIGAHMAARRWFRRAREKRKGQPIASQASSGKSTSADDSGGP